MMFERERAGAPGTGPKGPDLDDARSLDLAVALRGDRHAWVQWKHQGLAGSPLDEPGRFVAPRNGLLSHLQEPAGNLVPLGVAPFRYLKPYSRDPGLALSVAAGVGLFGSGGAVLSREPDGRWLLTTNRGLSVTDEALARLLSRAVLAYLDAVGKERPS